jgi:hypothetical protein
MLFLLTEMISILLVIKARAMHVDDVRVYILPLMALMPVLGGIGTYRQIRSNFAATLETESVTDLLQKGISTVLWGYAALLFALIFAGDCLRR